MEVFDPTTDEWKDNTPLTSGRSGHASAVCYQHLCLPVTENEAQPTVLKKISKKPSPSTSRNDDIPMANNIIGTLSNSRQGPS